MIGVSELVLSAESVRRIAEGRRVAESKLKAALADIPESDDIEAYLPAFSAFALVLCYRSADRKTDHA
jgi:hypothetical protein